MRSANEIVKEVRLKSNLTQKEFAECFNVSEVLISKIEQGQKEVSKKFLEDLAYHLKVHPSALAPFLFLNKDIKKSELSSIERQVIDLGEKIQHKILRNKKIEPHVSSNQS